MVCHEESFCVFRRLRPEGSRGASEKPPCFSAGIFIPRGVFRQLRPEGDWGRAESPQCARRRKLLPRRGLTRRLRRGLGLAVPRGAHTFLSVAKEKCAKESQRHGDSGKKPFIAHFGGGARYVARSIVGQITHAIVRARSSPFSAVKMGGPFSLRCLSPLCSGTVGCGHTHPLQVGMFQCGLYIFATQKANGISNPRWPF